MVPQCITRKLAIRYPWWKLSPGLECMEILRVTAKNVKSKQSLYNVVQQSLDFYMFKLLVVVTFLFPYYSWITESFMAFANLAFSQTDYFCLLLPVSQILFLPSVASCPTEIDCSAVTATLASCWQARGAEEGFLKFRRVNKQNLTLPQSSDTRSDCCFSFWFSSEYLEPASVRATSTEKASSF